MRHLSKLEGIQKLKESLIPLQQRATKPTSYIYNQFAISRTNSLLQSFLCMLQINNILSLIAKAFFVAADASCAKPQVGILNVKRGPSNEAVTITETRLATIVYEMDWGDK